jgi:serine/threonine protein kinase
MSESKSYSPTLTGWFSRICAIDLLIERLFNVEFTDETPFLNDSWKPLGKKGQRNGGTYIYETGLFFGKKINKIDDVKDDINALLRLMSLPKDYAENCFLPKKLIINTEVAYEIYIIYETEPTYMDLYTSSKSGVTKELLEDFVMFSQEMVRFGIRHSDLNAGNILYSVEKRKFKLIDFTFLNTEPSKTGTIGMLPPSVAIVSILHWYFSTGAIFCESAVKKIINDIYIDFIYCSSELKMKLIKFVNEIPATAFETKKHFIQYVIQTLHECEVPFKKIPDESEDYWFFLNEYVPHYKYDEFAYSMLILQLNQCFYKNPEREPLDPEIKTFIDILKNYFSTESLKTICELSSDFMA